MTMLFSSTDRLDQAVTERSETYEGVFFYGVRTTGAWVSTRGRDGWGWQWRG